MIRDRIAFDLPAYDGLLAGHYLRGSGYGRKRPGGTDDWLLVMTLRGEGRFGTPNGDRPATANTLHLISPGTTHDYGIGRSAPEWEILWVHFHPPRSWLDLLRWNEVAPGLHELIPPSPEVLANAFREVLDQSLTPGPYRLQLAMNALERLILLCAAQAPRAGRAMDERVRAAIDHIHAHPRRPHTAQSLSDIAGLSVSRFSHLFKEEVGLAPHQYVLQRRLLEARQLLDRTSLSVNQIAHAVGMDPITLSQRFRQHFGQSPRAFRRGEGRVSGPIIGE